jgi:hypothetical protein
VTSPANGAAVLGGTAAAFSARYGQPNAHSDPAAGELHFQRYGDSQTDFLVVQLDLFDGTALAQQVYSVTAQAPPQQPWNLSMAQTTCQAFAPADATTIKVIPISSTQGIVGVDALYRSPTLARTFPASRFSDAVGNPVTPGTFDVLYRYAAANDSNRIDSCTIELGTQQAPYTGTGRG